MSRPFTFGNLAISLDGRISTADRALHGFGGREDRDLMEELRSQADAVMIGAATVRDENPRLRLSSQKWIEARRLAGREQGGRITGWTQIAADFSPPSTTSGREPGQQFLKTAPIPTGREAVGDNTRRRLKKGWSLPPIPTARWKTYPSGMN